MAIKQGREYRALQDFSLVPRDEGSKEYRVRGTAIVFNSPTVLWECDGVEYKEIIDRHAFDECDMSDVIFNYNHGGKVVARLRNKTLALNIDERGVNIDADLGGTTAGRELYEEIDGGYVDKMSFSFTVREASYDSVTHTRTITKVKKLYDVSAVDIPAYNDTSISARSFFEEEHSRELAALEQARRRKKLVARKSPRRGIKRGSPRKELRSRLGKTTPPRSLSRIKSGTRITPRRRCVLYSSRKNISTSE